MRVIGDEDDLGDHRKQEGHVSLKLTEPGKKLGERRRHWRQKSATFNTYPPTLQEVCSAN